MSGPLVRFNPAYPQPFIVSKNEFGNNVDRKTLLQMQDDIANALLAQDAQRWHVDHYTRVGYLLVFGETHALKVIDAKGETEGPGATGAWTRDQLDGLAEHLNDSGFRPDDPDTWQREG